MNVVVATKKRTFNLTNLNEGEGQILRTLLNLNDDGLKKALLGDREYWENEVPSLAAAMDIAREIRDKVFNAVDSEL